MHPTQLQMVLNYLKQGHQVLPPQPMQSVEPVLNEGQQILGRMPTVSPPVVGKM